MIKMFDTFGLRVMGTREQFENFSQDAHEFDYIKNSLERIRNSAQTKAKSNNETDYVRFMRLKGGTYLITASINGSSNLLAYNVKEKRCMDEVSIDDLEYLRNESHVQYMMEVMGNYQNNMVSEAQMDKIRSICSSSIRDVSTTSSPTALCSDKGFYVGDPAMVLKNETLNQIRTKNGEIKSGTYQTYGGHRMMVVDATNGTVAGHEIYSGSIGIIPIEMLDKSKVMAIGVDNLDIRLGKSINAISKNSKLYIAQSDIQEIDTQVTDVSEMACSDIAYNI